MQPQEYLDEIATLEKQMTTYKKVIDGMKRELSEKYAQEHNKVQVGDLVSNSITEILVDRIEINIYTSQPPDMTYHGQTVNKEGNTFKYAKAMSVPQRTLVSINRVKIKKV